MHSRQVPPSTDREPNPTRRTARWTAAILLGTLLAGSVGWPERFAEASPSAPSQVEVCASVEQLTDAGFPQRAIALIDRSRPAAPGSGFPICPQERAAALVAVENAQMQALQASDRNTVSAAVEQAESALELDQENALAREIAGQTEPNPWQKASKAWEKLVEGSLSPLWGLALPALALAAALLLIARLLVFVIPVWTRWTPAGLAGRAVPVGVILTVAAAYGLVAYLAFTEPAVRADQLFTGRPQLWWSLSCLLGVVVTAWGLAARLRIGVVARKGPEQDEAGAAHVLALLDDLGASPPKGLEKPQGADVQALANALDAAPENPVAKVVKPIVGAITGWQPWQVRVDEEADGVVSVAISRNGRTKGGAVIDLRALDLVERSSKPGEKGPAVDPHRLVAAVVLTTLARYHKGFEGLCGATDWRSIGLHYVATTDFRADEEIAGVVLGRAVDRDPANWLAQVALASHRWREATEPPDLKRYVAWLTHALSETKDQKEKTKPGFATLRLRLESTLAAVRINQAYATEPAIVVAGKGLDEARAAIARSCVGLYLADSKETGSAWLATARARAGAQSWLFEEDSGDLLTAAKVRLSGGAIDPKAEADKLKAQLSDWRQLPRGPWAHYSYGCAYSSRGLYSKAATEFDQAVVRSDLADWMHDDPQLTEFRKSTDYQRFAPKARAELLSVAPFEPIRSELERLGLTHAAAWSTVLPNELAQGIPTTQARASALKDLAMLASSLDKRELLKPISIEILALLIKEGLVRSAQLRDVAVRCNQQARHELAQRLAKACHRFRTTTATEAKLTNEIEGWIRSVR